MFLCHCPYCYSKPWAFYLTRGHIVAHIIFNDIKYESELEAVGDLFRHYGHMNYFDSHDHLKSPAVFLFDKNIDVDTHDEKLFRTENIEIG